MIHLPSTENKKEPQIATLDNKRTIQVSRHQMGICLFNDAFFLFQYSPPIFTARGRRASFGCILPTASVGPTPPHPRQFPSMVSDSSLGRPDLACGVVHGLSSVVSCASLRQRPGNPLRPNIHHYAPNIHHVFFGSYLYQK